MINIAELTKAHVGRWVVYTDGVGDTERGKLKSWNDTTIFVVFKCGGAWAHFQDYTGQGCNPADVAFEAELAGQTKYKDGIIKPDVPPEIDVTTVSEIDRT